MASLHNVHDASNVKPVPQHPPRIATTNAPHIGRLDSSDMHVPGAWNGGHDDDPGSDVGEASLGYSVGQNILGTLAAVSNAAAHYLPTSMSPDKATSSHVGGLPDPDISAEETTMTTGTAAKFTTEHAESFVQTAGDGTTPLVGKPNAAYAAVTENLPASLVNTVVGYAPGVEGPVLPSGSGLSSWVDAANNSVSSSLCGIRDHRAPVHTPPAFIALRTDYTSPPPSSLGTVPEGNELSSRTRSGVHGSVELSNDTAVAKDLQSNQDTASLEGSSSREDKFPLGGSRKDSKSSPPPEAAGHSSSHVHLPEANNVSPTPPDSTTMMAGENANPSVLTTPLTGGDHKPVVHDEPPKLSVVSPTPRGEDAPSNIVPASASSNQPLPPNLSPPSMARAPSSVFSIKSGITGSGARGAGTNDGAHHGSLVGTAQQRAVELDLEEELRYLAPHIRQQNSSVGVPTLATKDTPAAASEPSTSTGHAVASDSPKFSRFVEDVGVGSATSPGPMVDLDSARHHSTHGAVAVEGAKHVSLVNRIRGEAKHMAGKMKGGHGAKTADGHAVAGSGER